LKKKLLELLQSTQLVSNLQDDPNASKIQAGFDKEILLEEAALIHRLHEWILKKGKPAIMRVMELEDKVDDYEEQVNVLKHRIKVLSDEVTKVNEERNVLQFKYDNLSSDKAELQETVKTALTYSLKDDSSNKSAKVRRIQSQIEELTSKDEAQSLEIDNLRKMNSQYMTETISLRKKLQHKDHQIAEIVAERDEWENRFAVTEQDYQRSMQEIDLSHTLQRVPSDYKDIRRAGTLEMREGVPRGLQHLSSRTIGTAADGALSNITSMVRRLSWKTDVTVLSTMLARTPSATSKYGDVGPFNLQEPMLDTIPSSGQSSSTKDGDAGGTNTSFQLSDTEMQQLDSLRSMHANVYGVAGMDIRSLRLSLWCVVFWMFSIAELAYYGHLSHANREDLGYLLYLIADLALFLGVLATMNHVHLESSIFQTIGGGLFVLGGILHLVATTIFVGDNCNNRDCVVLHFGTDFMAQFLSLFLGVDILSSGLGKRIYRVLGLSLLLSVCTIIIGSVWEDEHTVLDDELRGTSLGIGAVGFWISGVVSLILFLGLSAMTLIGVDDENMNRNAVTYTLNATIGFILLDSAGMLFYALPGYQVLLMLGTASILAYDMLFM